MNEVDHQKQEHEEANKTVARVTEAGPLPHLSRQHWEVQISSSTFEHAQAAVDTSDITGDDKKDAKRDDSCHTIRIIPMIPQPAHPPDSTKEIHRHERQRKLGRPLYSPPQPAPILHMKKEIDLNSTQEMRGKELLENLSISSPSNSSGRNILNGTKRKIKIDRRHLGMGKDEGMMHEKGVNHDDTFNTSFRSITKANGPYLNTDRKYVNNEDFSGHQSIIQEYDDEFEREQEEQRLRLHLWKQTF